MNKKALHEDLSNILSTHGLATESYVGDDLVEVLCQCYDGEERGVFKTHTEFRHHMADVAMGIFEKYVNTEWATLGTLGIYPQPNKFEALKTHYLTGGEPLMSRVVSEWTKMDEHDD